MKRLEFSPVGMCGLFFFIFIRIDVLMQRWPIFVVIGGWMVVALMRIRYRASLVWKKEKNVDGFG